MPRLVLHIDMDAFFAAIEQSDHPEWKGKPVVVGADPKGGKGRGVVSTCSYEARVFGVRSAMPVSKAYTLCPQAVYVYPRGRRYAEVSRQVMRLLGAYSPDIQQISVDEAFLDISSTQRLFGGAESLARMIKADILAETHLTCSIGIAPNKFIAKIASDLRKPDGLVIVAEAEVKQFLAPLEISRLWGVGPKTVPVMHRLGIHTIGDLTRFSQEELLKRLGQSGLHFWRLANGFDERAVVEEAETKSVSRETTFEMDCDDEEMLRSTLFYLCDDLCYDMRRHGLSGRTVTLKIRLEDFSTFTRSYTMEHVTHSSDELFQQVQKLYAEFDRQGLRVRLIGAKLSNLQQGEKQMDLFAERDDRKDKLDRVMDNIRQKFGAQSINRASVLKGRRDSQWIRE